jgi:hypothetical protein
MFEQRQVGRRIDAVNDAAQAVLPLGRVSISIQVSPSQPSVRTSRRVTKEGGSVHDEEPQHESCRVASPIDNVFAPRTMR